MLQSMHHPPRLRDIYGSARIKLGREDGRPCVDVVELHDDIRDKLIFIHSAPVLSERHTRSELP